MNKEITYYKNSNTEQLIKKQHFSGLSFDCPDYFYDWDGKEIDTSDLTGFVEISEKKFNREVKKRKRSFEEIGSGND